MFLEGPVSYVVTGNLNEAKGKVNVMMELLESKVTMR